MKAKNTNGNIIIYSNEDFKEKFNNYTLKDGRNSILFYLAGTEILESEGFYNVVIPILELNQRLGIIQFDEVEKVFKYQVEEISNEDINIENTKKYKDLLKQKVYELRIKAKGLSIGKTGSENEIITQVELYLRKYENAINSNPILEIDKDLANEGLRDFGIDLVQFKNIIIQKGNQTRENEKLLMSFIEQVRSSILTLIDNANLSNDWTKVIAGYDLIDSFKDITTVDEARIIKNQILKLC